MTPADQTPASKLSRRLALGATALVAAGVLAACGSDEAGDDHTGHDPAPQSHGEDSHAQHEGSGDPTSVAADANSADVDFATMMIPHHAQAVEMADLVPSRTQNSWLRGFAEEIKSAQQPEIDQLTRALQAWGEPVPDTHAHHEMDGMMTPEQMTHLESLSGEAFDREWITMMIAHHRGAVDMSRAELADGENPEMRGLAQEIIDSQQAEITEMEQQLKE